MKSEIIVPTYGNEDFTCRCFRSIRENTSGYRLVWADDGSDQKSREIVFPEAMANADMLPIWSGSNAGFITGVNNALKLLIEVYNTDADYIVLLNNDVEVTNGWLDRMIRVMERDSKVMAVGPIASECGSWQSYINATGLLKMFQVPDGFQTLGTRRRAESLNYCYGELAANCRMLAFFCVVFRTDVFREIGYLDEDFGVGYGEDDDFCKRMRDAKMKLSVSMGTYVFHNHMGTFGKIYSDSEIKDMRKQRLELYRHKHGEDAVV